VIASVFGLSVVSAEFLWGLSLALLALLLFGACMVAISVVLKGMSSGPGSFVAAVAGVPVGLAIGAIQLAVRGGVELPSAWAIGAFALAGICSTYLGRWLMFRSIELIGPSSAAGLQSTSPMITALFGWVFLGEVIGVAGFLGMGLGIVGLAAMSIGIGQAQRPVAGGPGPARASVRQGGLVFGTMVLGLVAAASYSGSHVFRAYAVRQWNEPLLGATIGAVAGALALALASRNKLAGYVREIRANPQPARIYFAVGALQFAAQALVIASMRYIPASLAALISMCTPLAVMPISHFVLRKREKLSRATVLGICITLAGVALIVLYGPGRVRP
jgi:drug/metabolite transporter (DMT)-like permease